MTRFGRHSGAFCRTIFESVKVRSEGAIPCEQGKNSKKAPLKSIGLSLTFRRARAESTSPLAVARPARRQDANQFKEADPFAICRIFLDANHCRSYLLNLAQLDSCLYHSEPALK